jgi:hypothetical protein
VFALANGGTEEAFWHYVEVVERLRVDRGDPPWAPFPTRRPRARAAGRPSRGSGDHRKVPDDDPIVLAAIKGIKDGIGKHPPLSEAEMAANRERLRKQREARP